MLIGCEISGSVLQMLREARGVFSGHGRFPRQQFDMYLGPLYAVAEVERNGCACPPCSWPLQPRG